ncbi:MAG: endonuclease/exonuclease/phosphatase family protein [Arcobacteraceae bacterium]|nr:endonuclease/exonuclease/phosphatase family protein [Arcobacteraceae bacterium]
MKILYIFIFVFSFFLEAKDFKVASYNVENLFDLKYDGTEYKEYKPNTKTWNKNSFSKKIENIAQVINDLNADIIALQEIESKEALNTLVKKAPQYKYHTFLKKETSSVGVALLSIYPIKNSTKIDVDSNDKYSRYILKATVLIEDKKLIIFVNHWRSKRAAESKRIIYAMGLKKEIDSLDKNEDYIILGDLNSNYNEFQTFKYDKNLNDSFGITGINQILNTTDRENFIHIDHMLNFNKKVHYNLWLDLNDKKFSTIFKGEYNTPDNIILSQGLFDQKGISYVQNSFNVFKTHYLIEKNKIRRWNNFKNNGYSDHLPIYAIFSTNKQNYILQNQPSKINTIEHLYNVQTVTSYPLDNIIVIYKSKKMAVIKRKNDRAIMIFNPPSNLQLGFGYNIVVNSIDLYNGLKEIKKISDIQKLNSIENYSNYYIDANTINLFDIKNQNNIIKNLTGVYQKGYLYFKKGTKEEKIKLYFYKELQRPKDGEKITITSGHLSIYKSKIQIVLYSKKDFIKHVQEI